MSDLDVLAARADEHVMHTYPPAPAAFVRGQGTVLFDADGTAWLDFLCGLAVTNLGHAHPAVTDAVARQAATLVHTSNLFLTEPAVDLAQRLGEVTGWDDARVFFAQCGATANEAAIKLARKHGKAQHPDKVRVVALEGSFHGRTLATLEATGQPAKHVPFAPLARLRRPRRVRRRRGTAGRGHRRHLRGPRRGGAGGGGRATGARRRAARGP